MTASLRGLAILAVIAALLGVLVVREARRPPPEPVDRALLPGLAVDTVRALTWDRSPLPPVTVTLGDPPEWSSGDAKARADITRVRDVLAAVRAARWHRRADAAAAGQVTVQLSLVAGSVTRVIGIGQELEGAEQQWVVVGEHAMLVDRWVARALAPDPLALRSTHPFERAADAKTLTVSPDIRIEHDPWHALIPQPLLPREDLVDHLVRAFEDLEIVRLSRPPAGEPQITFGAGVDGALYPTCPDDPSLAYLVSSAGDGCVPRAALEAVLSAAAALRRPPLEIAEPRISPGTVTEIDLADGARLDLTHVPRIAGGPADSARVAELLAVLAAPQEVVAPPKTRSERGRIFIEVGTIRITLFLLAGDVVARDSEPVALHLTPAAWQVLLRTGEDYAERSVWVEEPTSIVTLQIDGVTYKRSAVIGEWTRTPAGPVDGNRVEALVTALASVDRAPSATTSRFSPIHTVALTLAAFTGTNTHRLDVGPSRADGCTARTGAAATVHLASQTCTTIAALAN